MEKLFARKADLKAISKRMNQPMDNVMVHYYRWKGANRKRKGQKGRKSTSSINITNLSRESAGGAG
jgi:hypothetical protein